MKKKLLVFAIIVFTATGLAANTMDKKFQERYNLSDQQIEQIKKVQAESEEKKKQAESELKLQKAMLERELIQEKVDMKKVEKIMRDSLEYQLKIQMADIEKRVKTREIMGTENYDKMIKMLKNNRDDDKQSQKKTDDKNKNKNKK